MLYVHTQQDNLCSVYHASNWLYPSKNKKLLATTLAIDYIYTASLVCIVCMLCIYMYIFLLIIIKIIEHKQSYWHARTASQLHQLG